MDNKDIYIQTLEKRLRGLELGGVVPRTIRVPSINEQYNTVKRSGYYEFFCIHDVHKWTRCAKCKRTTREAQRNREIYQSKLVVATHSTR